MDTLPPTAVVMNLFYTGLGVARSLGEHGVPVVGLSAHRRIYGNFTRYARVVACPDSRTEPEALATQLLKLGKQLGERAVLFPTRDDDLLLLDRFRDDLAPYFRMAIPSPSALQASLDKWETYQWALRAGVATPKCWRIETAGELRDLLGEITFPCVLKPVAAHHWRKGTNWQRLGARKAISISSPAELLAEYAAVAQVEGRILVQELVPGGDDQLMITACYLDRESQWVAGFNTQKLVQTPAGFGTGCIVRATDVPALLHPTRRLLQSMGFTGIAEVEYKRDPVQGIYKLIEINPRLWDQHRLGKECGVDLAYLAYCEHAGLPRPPVTLRGSGSKWIAEDTFVITAARLLWRRDVSLFSLFRMARGKRIYAIWSVRDPLPAIGYFMMRFLPGLLVATALGVWSVLTARRSGAIARAGRAQDKQSQDQYDLVYKRQLERGKSHG